MRILSVLTLVLLPSLAFAADPAWIEYGSDGAIVRAIVENGGKCPHITIDGVESRMRLRAEAGHRYEVTSCEVALPDGARKASVDGVALPVAKLGKATRVAILGDTGCRHKKGDPVQNCKTGWPFAQVAQSIADWDPDVVLHVGDYYYREADCDKKGNCVSMPYSWKRWNEDFFTPAAPLLANAPWVLVRGNHEACGRAAEGWFRFLDTEMYMYEGKKQCTSNLNTMPPYAVTVGAQQIILLDTSALDDDDDDQAAMFAAQLELFAQLKPGAWIATHDPFWAAKQGALETPTLWKAWTGAGTATNPISLVLNGHIHLLELITFDDGRPPQIVSGNGGTSLASLATDPTGQPIGGRTVKTYQQAASFGFLTATRTPSGWALDVRDASGAVKTKCAVTETAIVCD
jgi:hypothetical protein